MKFIIDLLLFSKIAEAKPLQGLDETATGMGYYLGSQMPLANRVGLYMNWLVSFLGVILLALVMYSGFLWMTAQGDSKQVDKAKDILKQSVIGLILVVSAYAITYFIGDFASGLTRSK